jgi:hypothetical protein
VGRTDAAQECRSVDPRCVEHRPKIVHPFLQRRQRRESDWIRGAGPSLVEEHETAEGAETPEQALERRELPLSVDIAEPLVAEDEVLSLPDHLVRDVQVAALRVPSLGRFHAR